VNHTISLVAMVIFFENPTIIKNTVAIQQKNTYRRRNRKIDDRGSPAAVFPMDKHAQSKWRCGKRRPHHGCVVCLPVFG